MLLNGAYAPLAAAGMKFLASHQNANVTKRRAERGLCFVGELNGKIVGTITMYAPADTGDCPYYYQPGVWHFGQFAVKPELQGVGFGEQLLNHVESKAIESGAVEIALDTSENADRLIAWYVKRGYHPVGEMDWDATNYKSIILAKRL